MTTTTATTTATTTTTAATHRLPLLDRVYYAQLNNRELIERATYPRAFDDLAEMTPVLADRLRCSEYDYCPICGEDF